ncbi:hypothetical protein K505DRAFT_337570 [Melanomma pulvis-pyrius CBS 109.77]|uniref:Uncharacterized protein n=1 Tax=Melanomma pulvis-pyrius CBS 109.77 TaxID=1314802 RepID=A0A6A6XCG8_9PLEO|nr:hypothetical protein K505DRAFT_337570 [Melanomma pulvis-pyrius CBS 109.77]
MKSFIAAGIASISYARLVQPAGSSTRSATENCNAQHISMKPRGNGSSMGDCRDFEEGAAPLPDKDKWEAFMELSEYSRYAFNTDMSPNFIEAFQDLNSTVNDLSYIEHHTIYAYEPSICANWCNISPSYKIFNIYISRDPSKDHGPSCGNPPATTKF